MSSKKLAKKVLITTLSASMVLPFGSAVYANTQAEVLYYRCNSSG